MTTAWPNVPLGEVLRRVERFERRDDTAEYRFAGTYSFARGIFARPPVAGSSFRLGEVQRVKSGDFVYCKIMAWEGAFGTVPPEADDHVMSGAFVAYEPQLERVMPAYLDWYFKVPHVWQDVGRHSTGTNVRRRSLHPAQFESATIPLPPLPEQRRIAARIEELAGKVAQTAACRRDSAEATLVAIDAVRAQEFEALSKNGTAPLEQVAVLERGKFSYRPRNETRFFGGVHPWIQIGEIEASNKYIRSWSQTLNDDGLAISKKFRKGTLLISIAATIGAVGILDFDCCVPDSIVGVTPKQESDKEFLYHFLLYARAHLERVAPQSAQKNINLRILSMLAVPRASPEQQRRVVSMLDALQAKVAELKRLQAETQAELDALLPSILDRAFKGEL